MKSRFGETLLQAAKDFRSQMQEHTYLSQAPQIYGESRYGTTTKAEVSRWRKKALDYAAQWDLESQFAGSYEGDFKKLENDEIASMISTQTEERQDSMLWQYAEDFGYPSARAMYEAMETALYDL